MDRNLHVCWYFNTKNGCRNGDHCPYIHRKRLPSDVPKCRNYRGPGTCRYGDNCFFRHEDDVDEISTDVEKQNSVAEVEMEAKGLSSSCTSIESELEERKQGEAVALDTSKSSHDAVRSMNKLMKKSPRKQRSPKGHEKYLSVQINNKVKDNSTPIKSARQIVDQVSGAEGDSNNNAVAIPNRNEADDHDTENRTLTCGECGVVLQDSPLDSDDSHSLDELQKHYKDKILVMDKTHTKFLKTDPRFKFPTSCGVCGRDLVNSYSLLRHITDKIKSRKNDWEMHENFLETITDGLWERDIGLTDEKQCLDWLLLHLVESYEGEDTDSDSDDDGLHALFGLMALGKHIHGGSHFYHDYEDDDSPDSDDYGNPWGMDDDDVWELACLGIKPWDAEAGAALAVLNGHF